MSLTRKVAHNTLYQMLGKGASSLLGLAAIGLLTRFLGREGFGEYTTVLTFVQIFGILIDFGITLVTIQMISEPDANRNKILSNIFAARVISAFLFFGLAPAVALFMPYSAAIKIGVAIASAAFFFNAISQVPIGVFQKEIRTEFMVLAEILNRLVFLGLTAAFIFFNLTLGWFLFANSVSMAVYFTILYVSSRKFSRIYFAFDWGVWKEIWRRSYPLALTIVLNLVYLRGDVFILSIFRSQEEVGIYGAPYKIVDAIVAFIFVFIGMVLGVLSGSWAEGNKERFNRVTQRTLDALTAIAIPLVLGGIMLAEPMMVFVAGEKFAISSGVFRVLLIALWWIFFGTLFTHTVIALKKQKKIVWGFAADAVLSLIGYLIFIPRYSYWGAAGVTIFSEMFIAVWAYLLTRKTSGFKISFSIPLKSLAAAAVMICFLYVFPLKILLVQIGAGALVYAAVFYLLGGYNKEMIKEIISIKKS
jgi:O-antigen/teichoic acid export membrane protein